MCGFGGEVSLCTLVVVGREAFVCVMIAAALPGTCSLCAPVGAFMFPGYLMGNRTGREAKPVGAAR